MIDIYREDRPWGYFERFTKNVPTTVKIITINQGQSLSLQYHAHRQEFWRILEGTPMVTVGDKVTSAKAGDNFIVAEHINHRIAAPLDKVVFLEIATGDFDESDIVRLDDQYGRN